MTIVIPDVHEQAERLERIVARALARTGDVVCLGDYFDAFDSTPASTQRTIDWLREAVQDARLTLLLGNHDLHYRWPRQMRCSGYRLRTAVAIGDCRELGDRFFDLRERTFTVRHSVVLSHAGFHPDWLGAPWDEAVVRHEIAAGIRAVNDCAYHRLFAVGIRRGGTSEIAGPFWLDVRDFGDAEATMPPQVFGHTPGATARRIGRSVCIDTHLRKIAVITDDGIQVETAD